MSKRLTLTARSPLGQWVAVALVSIILLAWGVEIASDGSFFKSSPSSFTVASGTVRIQQASMLDSISLQLKKYPHQDMLVAYGAAIFLGFAVSGILGRWIRSYRFRLLTRAKGGAPAGGVGGETVVECREMWLFIYVWQLIWLGMAGFFALVLWNRPWTTVSAGLILAVAGPAALFWLAWALFPDAMARTFRVPWIGGWRRIPWWAPAWVVLAVLLPVVGWLARLRFSVDVPSWLLPAGVVPAVPLVLLWLFVPRVAGFRLYVPGFRWRVPAARVKRLEIQTSGEGAAELVMTLRDERTWTLGRGTARRLQRVGGTLGRALGLERRDLVTWA